MYDPMAEPREFIAGSRAEAVAKASQFFGLPEDQLTVHDVPATEVSGLASRAAIVVLPQGRPRAEGRRERSGGAGPRETGPRERRGPRGERSERRAEPAAPSTGTALTELNEVGEFVLGLVERLELGPFELSESEDQGNLVILVRGTAAQRLTEDDARVIGALQLLAAQVAMRLDGPHRRVIVDIEGKPERRAEYLERLAERAAERAKQSGRGVALDPMNPRDRRVVHTALRDVAGIATMSVGEGRYRQVVVVPEGAPEYEDARRYEAAAARSEEQG